MPVEVGRAGLALRDSAGWVPVGPAESELESIDRLSVGKKRQSCARGGYCPPSSALLLLPLVACTVEPILKYGSPNQIELCSA